MRGYDGKLWSEGTEKEGYKVNGFKKEGIWSNTNPRGHLPFTESALITKIEAWD